jgi:hypothetical protein
MSREMTINAKELSPREQVAQAMLLLHRKDPMAALTVMNAASSAVADLFANDPDPSPDEINAAAEGAVQALGFVTDLDSLSRQFDYLQQNHAGFWTGNYTLVDSQEEVHTLLVNSQQVRLLLGGVNEVVNVPSEGASFAGRKLTVDNDAVAVSLTWTTTLDGVDNSSGDRDLRKLAEEFRVMVAGTLKVKADGTVRDVKGQRGVATPVAVLQGLVQDPPGIWAGEYGARYTDTDNWEYVDGHLFIDYDAKAGSLGVRLGAVRATDVTYTSGVIRCRMELSKGVASTVTMDLRTTSSGRRRCYVWIETTGQMRTLTAYALQTLDPAVLWGKAVTKPGPAFAASAGPVAPRVALGGAVVDFCRTPYDAEFLAGDLVVSSNGVLPSVLLAIDTIKVGGVNVTGFRVDETDAQGNPTGRIALFTSTATAPGFLAGSKAKAYQQLDEAGQPQAGLANAMVGILSPKPFELPGLVETDFYEVRLSLRDYTAILPGLRFSLAIDDTRQPGLITLADPLSTNAQCAYDPAGGNGPDAATMTRIGDYTKASVLVRGATGETQNVGQKTYFLAVASKTTSGVFSGTKTIYKPAATAGEYVVDGTAQTLDLPILMRVPIQMDSRDALELSGTSWAPAVRGKVYSASVTAMKGQQPFVWRILQSDLPSGLAWQKVAGNDPAVNTDIQQSGLVTFGITGTVDAGADPGSTHQPVLRVMSDRSVVMKPVVASPQITVDEPETEGKLAGEVSNVLAAVVSALAAVGSFIVTIVLWRKDKAREEKQQSSDDGIELKTLSVDTLRDFGQEFTSLADAVDKIKESKKYVDKVGKALKGFKDVVGEIKTSIQTLEEKIGEAKSKQEFDRLTDELKDAREKLEEKERELNEHEEDKQSIDEKNESKKE